MVRRVVRALVIACLMALPGCATGPQTRAPRELAQPPRDTAARAMAPATADTVPHTVPDTAAHTAEAKAAKRNGWKTVGRTYLRVVAIAASVFAIGAVIFVVASQD